MRATLEFKLPEEQDMLELAQRAPAMESMIMDMAEVIRREQKYPLTREDKGQAWNEGRLRAWQEMAQQMRDIRDEKGLSDWFFIYG